MLCLDSLMMPRPSRNFLGGVGTPKFNSAGATERHLVVPGVCSGPYILQGMCPTYLDGHFNSIFLFICLVCSTQARPKESFRTNRFLIVHDLSFLLFFFILSPSLSFCLKRMSHKSLLSTFFVLSLDPGFEI